MNIDMPLPPDFGQNYKMRTIKAEIPDDVTQKEFWAFIALVGSQLFGHKKHENDHEIRSNWNMGQSMQLHFSPDGLLD